MPQLVRQRRLFGVASVLRTCTCIIMDQMGMETELNRLWLFRVLLLGESTGDDEAIIVVLLGC